MYRSKEEKNNKGFSMIELLAAIVIIGLLSTMAVVGVNVVLNKAEKNHYETQEKNIIMAGKSYSQDNRMVLPKQIGTSRTITLQELQGAKYIGEVVDRHKRLCTEGSVTIYKYSQDEYSYKPYLKCPNYMTSGDNYGAEGPEVKLELDRTYTKPSFTYYAKAKGDNDKIISYSYIIYKYGVEIYNSGSVPVSKVKNIKNSVSLKKYVPGEFEIVFSATNLYGKTSTTKIPGDILDSNGPTCGEIKPVLTEWKNVPSVEITVKCEDETGSGCAKETFSQVFTVESKMNSIEIVDKQGNKTPCPVDTYIDRTAPSKPIITNPFSGDWTNKDYKKEVVSVDETSGIEYFEYCLPDSKDCTQKENWIKYDNSARNPKDNKPFVTQEFKGESDYDISIRACDYAGNCSESTTSEVKIDKTPPTCNISLNGTMGNQGFYVSIVDVNLNTNDVGGSNVAGYGLSTTNSAVYNDKKTVKQATVVDGITWYGFVKDAAGNTGSCDSGHFVVKASPPKITFSLSGETSRATCKSDLPGVNVSLTNGSQNLSSNLTHRVVCTDQYGITTTGTQNYGRTQHTSTDCGGYSCACTGCCGTCKSGYCHCCCGNCGCSTSTYYTYYASGPPSFSTSY